MKTHKLNGRELLEAIHSIAASRNIKVDFLFKRLEDNIYRFLSKNNPHSIFKVNISQDNGNIVIQKSNDGEHFETIPFDFNRKMSQEFKTILFSDINQETKIVNFESIKHELIYPVEGLVHDIRKGVAYVLYKDISFSLPKKKREKMVNIGDKIYFLYQETETIGNNVRYMVSSLANDLIPAWFKQYFKDDYFKVLGVVTFKGKQDNNTQYRLFVQSELKPKKLDEIINGTQSNKIKFHLNLNYNDRFHFTICNNLEDFLQSYFKNQPISRFQLFEKSDGTEDCLAITSARVNYDHEFVKNMLRQHFNIQTFRLTSMEQFIKNNQEEYEKVTNHFAETLNIPLEAAQLLYEEDLTDLQYLAYDSYQDIKESLNKKLEPYDLNVDIIKDRATTYLLQQVMREAEEKAKPLPLEELGFSKDECILLAEKYIKSLDDVANMENTELQDLIDEIKLFHPEYFVNLDLANINQIIIQARKRTLY